MSELWKWINTKGGNDKVNENLRQVLHKGVNRKHLVITPKFRMGVQNGQLRNKKKKKKKKSKKKEKKKFLYFFIVTQRIKYKVRR